MIAMANPSNSLLNIFCRNVLAVESNKAGRGAQQYLHPKEQRKRPDTLQMDLQVVGHG